MRTWIYRGICFVCLVSGIMRFERGVLGEEGPYFGPNLSPFPSPAITDEIVISPASGEMQPVLKPIPQSGPILETEPVPLYAGCDLFNCVRYRNLRKIAPCAVEMVVGVRTPCGCKKDPCKPCVYVKICVPPCNSCPKVKIRKQGDKVIYDYGKYAVELTSKKGEVIVAYHKAWF